MYLIGVIILTHYLSALTGFGCTILAMPFVAASVGLAMAKPLLLVMGTFQPYYTLAFQWRDVNWPILRRIALISGLGLPIGFMLYQYLPEKGLIIVLGFVMFFAGSTGIAKLQGVVTRFKSSLLMTGLLFAGGVIQGAFVTGGPLIVIYASVLLKGKDEFRATLSMLWVILNTIILAQLYFSGAFTPSVNHAILVNLPGLVVAVCLGQYTAGKVSKLFFDYLLNGVLCIAGIFIIANQWIQK